MRDIFAGGIVQNILVEIAESAKDRVDGQGSGEFEPIAASRESLAKLATRAGVEGGRFRVHTPLIDLTKAEIIRRGLALALDYGLTHSCYDPAPDGRPCGRCDSCALRARGFAEAGVSDPLVLR